MKTVNMLTGLTLTAASGPLLAHGAHAESASHGLLHLLTHNWPVLLLGGLAYGAYRLWSAKH